MFVICNKVVRVPLWPMMETGHRAIKTGKNKREPAFIQGLITKIY